MLKKFSVVVLLIAFLICLLGCSGSDTELQSGQMRDICEVATLECTYHDIAKVEKSESHLWWKTNSKLWIEYDGVVEIGFDAQKMDVKIRDNEVVIKLPDAEILSSEVDETNMEFYKQEKGMFHYDFTSDDEAEAVGEAQKDMRTKAKKNQLLINQATENAKSMIESYIYSVGEIADVDYVIKWNE